MRAGWLGVKHQFTYSSFSSLVFVCLFARLFIVVLLPLFPLSFARSRFPALGAEDILSSQCSTAFFLSACRKECRTDNQPASFGYHLVRAMYLESSSHLEQHER